MSSLVKLSQKVTVEHLELKRNDEANPCGLRSGRKNGIQLWERKLMATGGEEENSDKPGCFIHRYIQTWCCLKCAPCMAAVGGITLTWEIFKNADSVSFSSDLLNLTPR